MNVTPIAFNASSARLTFFVLPATAVRTDIAIVNTPISMDNDIAADLNLSASTNVKAINDAANTAMAKATALITLARP